MVMPDYSSKSIEYHYLKGSRGSKGNYPTYIARTLSHRRDQSKRVVQPNSGARASRNRHEQLHHLAGETPALPVRCITTEQDHGVNRGIGVSSLTQVGALTSLSSGCSFQSRLIGGPISRGVFPGLFGSITDQLLFPKDD